MVPRPRFHLEIFKRWGDLLFLLIIGFLVCFSGQSLIISIGKVLIAISKEWHWVIQISLFSLIIGILWFILIRLGGFRLRDFWNITSFRYPPTWVVAVIATIFYLFFQPSLSGNLNPKDVKQMLFCSIFIISPLIFGIASADLLNRLWEWKPSTKVSNTTIMSKKGGRGLSSLYKDPDAFALIEWLQKETPIQSPTEDLFELAVLARRIVLTLSGSPLKTIVLIGPYGCGKSSIFKMVSFYLENPNELLGYLKLDQGESVFDYESIVTCELSAWGLHGGAAAEHILKIITRELSKHVDCLGLAGLPSNYRSAISNSASLWSKILFNFLDFHQDPIEVLHKLDTVLGCAQKRLVIFIEDLDRNPDGQVFWNEIISLLDRLKSLENVAFVLAISQARKLLKCI